MAAPKAARRSVTRPTKRKAAPARSAARTAPRAVRRTATRGRSDAAPAPNGVPAASAIGVVHQHLDFTSQDLDGVRRFYTEVLGFGNATHHAEFGYLTIFTTPTASLGFMPPVNGPPEQWRPPGEPALYFYVADVDAAHRALAAKGVAFEQPPRGMPWGDRVAILRDPEGRMICLAQRAKR
jgi:predicted enzyme related to lactoylglutathione lyase